MRSSVVLPAPFMPTIPTRSLLLMMKDTLFRTVMTPYALERLCTDKSIKHFSLFCCRSLQERSVLMSHQEDIRVLLMLVNGRDEARGFGRGYELRFIECILLQRLGD